MLGILEINASQPNAASKIGYLRFFVEPVENWASDLVSASNRRSKITGFSCSFKVCSGLYQSPLQFFINVHD
jgi:hypothetical protein